MYGTIVGRGFGNFSRVLGPWVDYFPLQNTQPDSQIGVALATQIDGGQKGAVITAITVDPPANVAGTLATIPWRILVIRGEVPKNLEPIQQALQGMPRVGASDLPVPVLWEKMISAGPNANNDTSANTQACHFPFPDFTGPSVGPGEVMSVIVAMLSNETGVPGYGAANRTYVSLSVFGSYQGSRAGATQGVGDGARALNRGVAGR